MWQPLRRNELHFYFAPPAIFGLVLWTVAEYILVAQLYSNLSRHVGQFIGIGYGKHPPTRDLRDLRQKRRPGNFFRLGGAQAENADGINLHVGFLHHRFDLVFRVAAVVVATVRNDQKSLLGIMGVFHLAYAHVDGVEQRGASLRDCVNQLALDVFNGLGEVGAQLGTIVEGDHEEFVRRIGRLEEFDDGFARLLDFVRHAAAHVEDHAERDGRVFAGEVLHFLGFIAFKDGKVFFVQPGDDAVPVVCYGYIHQHQVHINDLGLAMVVAQAGICGRIRWRRNWLCFGSFWRRARLNMNVHVLSKHPGAHKAEKGCGEKAA